MAFDTHGANGKPWTGFDLDGTLAVYDKWRGVAHIGKPVKPMCDLIRKMHDEGKSVKILTARVAPREDGSHHLARVFIARWCRDNLGFVPPITHEKDALMETLYDDRVKAVEQNTGKVLNMAKFKVGDRVMIQNPHQIDRGRYGKIVSAGVDGNPMLYEVDFGGYFQMQSESDLVVANAARSRNAVVQKALNAWAPIRGFSDYEWKETAAERRIKSELRAAGAKSADYLPWNHGTAKIGNYDTLSWHVVAHEDDAEKVAAKMRQLGMIDVSKPKWDAYDNFYVVGYTKIEPMPTKAAARNATGDGKDYYVVDEFGNAADGSKTPLPFDRASELFLKLTGSKSGNGKWGIIRRGEPASMARDWYGNIVSWNADTSVLRETAVNGKFKVGDKVVRQGDRPWRVWTIVRADNDHADSWWITDGIIDRTISERFLTIANSTRSTNAVVAKALNAQAVFNASYSGALKAIMDSVKPYLDKRYKGDEAWRYPMLVITVLRRVCDRAVMSAGRYDGKRPPHRVYDVECVKDGFKFSGQLIVTGLLHRDDPYDVSAFDEYDMTLSLGYAGKA